MLTATDRSTAPVRRVRILTAGGTIAMMGEGGATPELDAEALVASVPGLQVFPDLEAITVLNKPSAHLTLEDQLRICRAARDAARRGIGVVVTHGTDVLEETAMLCDVLHDADAPIVFTGAIRPASAAGADGPANLVDAVSVAASAPAAGWASWSSSAARSTTRAARARPTRRRWSRSPRRRPARWAASPRAIRRSGHGSRATRRWIRRRWRSAHIVPSSSGDDGTLARAALGTEPDGIVLGTLGAGHLTPALLEIWAEAAREILGRRLLPPRARRRAQRDLWLRRVRA